MVAFTSGASNLVAGDRPNAWADVFVHDRLSGQTTRVSVAPDGTSGNDTSYEPALSADGQVVAFGSQASNLVPGDTNGSWDVFIRDRPSGQTTRVSVASDGTQSGYTPPFYPTSIALSGDGQVVAFVSYASNLVAGDTNAEYDVFVHDRWTGETVRVSVASDGTQSNDYSTRPQLSWDGRFVMFESYASTLVPQAEPEKTWGIFIHDRLTGETSRFSLPLDGTQPQAIIVGPHLAADGWQVTFASDASHLVPGDTNERDDIFIHDRRPSGPLFLPIVTH